MGVKCTHYKVRSVQSKSVYFSQFWSTKHFLGPVCDIWPFPEMLIKVDGYVPSGPLSQVYFYFFTCLYWYRVSSDCICDFYAECKMLYVVW